MKGILMSLCAISFLIVGCSMQGDDVTVAMQGPRACFDTNCFHMEVADTSAERQQGLMGRENLSADSGMLFVFPTSAAQRNFWMKNTLLDLDMIWLDEKYRIVHIEEDVPACTEDPCPTYGPDEIVSKYVIELNAGSVATLGSRIGDEVSLHDIDA